MRKRFHGLFALGLIAAAFSAEAQLSLTNYTRTGVFNLPSNAPGSASNLLANEASGVTYNWDTNTLFVVGDGGTSVVEVNLQGQLIGSMALSGFTNTSVGDPEGITYVGNGTFVVSFERIRNAAQFSYAAGTTLGASGMQQVTLGAPGAGNSGNEGIAYDPLTSGGGNGNGFIVVREAGPQGVFQTNINFAAGTATNGSASTANPTNLFNPSSMGLVALSDVQTLSTVQALAGTSSYADLLVLSYQSGLLVQVDRNGTVKSSLVLGSSVADAVSRQHEGVTIDGSGNIYVVSEIGGGTNVPQLWVYSPAQPIPEPASAMLMLAGLALIGRRLRRG